MSDGDGSDRSLVPPATRLVLDGSARRIDDGRVLIGGSPMRLMRMTAAGSRLVDRLASGEELGTGTGARRLARRLLDRGMAHPRVVPSAAGADEVTVVIPVFDRAAGLERTLAAIARADVLPGAIVVVDDGSPGDGPAAAAAVAAAAGARFVARPGRGGPGAARNSGLERVDTPLVAFVDSDVEPAPDWLARLLPHFDDGAVVAVAPRVIPAESSDRPPNSARSADPMSPLGSPLGTDSVPNRRRGAVGGVRAAGSWSLEESLDRFERSRSPLDLGPEPARVAPRTRVAYVPTATILARVAAVREVGAFDERLAFGEDVDLVWRLAEAGHTVRYEPSATVTHPVRPDLASWLRQRFDYGCSAAPLAARHPEALAPVSISAWSAAAWTLAATGFPLTGLGVAAAAAVQLPRRLGNLDHPWRESLRLAGGGTVGAWRPLSSAVTRTWWPAALAGSLVSRRVRRAVLAATIVPPLVDWLGGDRDIDLATYVALRLLDDLAYGAGVWTGCARERTLLPLVPDLTSWPGRRPAVEQLPT
ncbi:MAG: mycofactocin biosynthesis glycosyltransferase MftF [Acidimicrobiales bacterium]